LRLRLGRGVLGGIAFPAHQRTPAQAGVQGSGRSAWGSGLPSSREHKRAGAADLVSWMPGRQVLPLLASPDWTPAFAGVRVWGPGGQVYITARSDSIVTKAKAMELSATP
jgi:hypothetical protein